MIGHNGLSTFNNFGSDCSCEGCVSRQLLSKDRNVTGSCGCTCTCATQPPLLCRFMQVKSAEMRLLLLPSAQRTSRNKGLT